MKAMTSWLRQECHQHVHLTCSTDSGPLPYQYRGVRINSANQTAWVTFCEFHSSLDLTTDIWRMFSLYNYRSYIYQLRYWSWEWLRASLDWLWWKERLHKFFFSRSSVKQVVPCVSHEYISGARLIDWESWERESTPMNLLSQQD